MLVVGLSGCQRAENDCQTDYTQYVNMLIGTGGHGHTNLAAMVPHGMIQPGPDTRIHGWDACSGYYYEDSKINGFAQTRLSGTGCADFGDFLIMPTTGEQDIHYVGEKEENQNVAWASEFSHENEIAEPGYYSVFLDKYGIKTEITSTTRAALYRFSYPKDETPGLILDLDYNIQEQGNLEMSFKIINDTTLQAFKSSNWWEYRQDIYLYAIFSKPFTYSVVQDTIQTSKRKEPRCKLLLHFDATEEETIYMKTAISSVDEAGAKLNLETEIPNWDFDGIRKAASDEWNKWLSKIDIVTDDVDKQTIFYTALYHTNLSPNIFQDVDGRYLGMDLKAHQGDVNDPNYTIFSLWDTFRALHPLISILDPHQNEAYIRSLIKKGQEGGLVPKWDCGANYTGCMLGYHFASLVTDSYVKGYRDFDVEEALQQARRCAEYSTEGITPACPEFLYPYIMPISRYYKETIGYSPCDKDKETVSKALEYAYDDWCIAVLADSLKQSEIAKRYYSYSQLYRRFFDKETGFMRGVDSEGQWREPFDPRHSDHRNDDYCEGNAFQWSWFVPHDVNGLVELYGGKDSFIDKLDNLFTESSEITGEEVSADISGLIGQYAHGNEPSHHIIHLYNYVGEQEKTNQLVNQVMNTLYHNAPDGLSGNEDCGQMSAWYILNALGFYQVCPGNALYSIGTPLFDEATIHLDNGKTFTIIKGKTPKLNGSELKTPFFTHEELIHGGILQIN